MSGKLDPRVPSADPLRPAGTDGDPRYRNVGIPGPVDQDPSGMTCVLVFIGCLVVLGFILGFVIGRITA